MNIRFSGLLLLICLGLLPVVLPRVQAQVRLVEVASGFSAPLYATDAPDDPSRLYVLEQGSSGTARIKAIHRPTGTIITVLTLTGLYTGGERGLLGLAFHPDFAINRYCYLYTSVPRQGSTGNHDSLIRRFTFTNPEWIEPGSARTVLRFSQDFSNHNGGWMDFGPDGYLYIATGDGGSGGDPLNRAQNINSLLGKMLRLDVDGPDAFPTDTNRNYALPSGNPFVGTNGLDEIFHFGLRNPWRCSFDRATGDLYIGDVGQANFEEIDFQHADHTPGINFGWRVMEGSNCFDNAQSGGNLPCSDTRLTHPVYDYPAGYGAFQGDSVTGGYVYRGPSPSLQGVYFFGDFQNSEVWSIRIDRNTGNMMGGSLTHWTPLLNDTIPGSLSNISSFGEDTEGNLLIITYGGTIYELLAETGPATTFMQPVSNQTVCITISNLTQTAANSVERSFDPKDDDDWQTVHIFSTILGETNWCDTVGGASSQAFYRVVSQ